MTLRNAWVITDGNAGMENQACGFAESMGLPYEVKRVRLRFPWKYVSPFIRFGKNFCVNSQACHLLPPWPDVIIASGRQSILPTLMVREKSGYRTKTIYLQTPAISPKYFDVVISPQHDACQGDNVLKSIGAPHQVTHDRLQNARSYFSELFGHYPEPRLGVLLGGSNKTYTLDHNVVTQLAQQLRHLQQQNVSIIMTPSRRTDAGVVQQLRAALEPQGVYIWEEQGQLENPYFGILAWSDALLVTCDSVCMISEACATDKPVYLLALPGDHGKFHHFHHTLDRIGRTQWWDGQPKFFPQKRATPFNETQILAQKVWDYLK